MPPIDDESSEKYVDMKMTAAERNGAVQTGMPGDKIENKYPWGLQIRLEKAQLEKLGIKRLPAAGDEMEIEACCVVTRVYESEGMGEEPDRAITLQITKMMLD